MDTGHIMNSLTNDRQFSLIQPLTLNIITSQDNGNQTNKPLTLNITTSQDNGIQTDKPLTLNIITSQDNGIQIDKPLTLNIIRVENGQGPRNSFEGIPSDHLCYILKSSVSNRTYVGYTINFPHRIRQHNGEIVGGAKRTMKGRPWYPICLIRGFYEASAALRFEYRLQHPRRRKRKSEDATIFTLQTLVNLINSGDGSISKNNKMPWPKLNIKWYDRRYSIQHHNIINVYE